MCWTHSKTSAAQRQHLRPEAADADICARTPHACIGNAQPRVIQLAPPGGSPSWTSWPYHHTQARSLRRHCTHRSWCTSTPHPILSPQNNYLQMQWSTPSHTWHAQSHEYSIKRAMSTTSTYIRSPMLQPAPGTPLSHWRAIECLFRYSPSTPNPHLTHAEISSPQKGHPNTMAASPWAGMPYRGVRPPSLRVGTSQPRMAARRHRALAAPPQTPSETSRVPPHPFSSVTAAIATTHERRDHHHHHPTSLTRSPGTRASSPRAYVRL